MAPLMPRPDAPVHFPSQLTGFNKPASTFLTDNSLSTVSGVASASVIFNTTDRILLIQRASHDSQPGTWESPGGGVDPEDPSILYASARELWEEAGLVGTRIIRVIPVHAKGANQALPELASRVFPNPEERNWAYQSVSSYFTNRTGTKIHLALSFQFADVEPGTIVTLDPNEHQNFRWVTEEEMLREVMDDGFPIPIAGRSMKPMLQQAFKIRREAGEMVTVKSSPRAKRSSLISFIAGGDSKRSSLNSIKNSASTGEREKRLSSDAPKRLSWMAFMDGANKRASFRGESHDVAEDLLTGSGSGSEGDDKGRQS